MNDVKQKIKKSSKIISVALLMAFIVMVMLSVFSVVSLITITSSDFGEQVLGEIVEEGKVIPLEANGESANLNQKTLVLVITMSILIAVVNGVMIFMVYRIFNSISKDYTPFKHEHVLKLKIVAIMSVAISLISSIGDFVLTGHLFEEGLLEFDYTYLILGGVVFCVAYIFDYGCMLQQQSDETL